MREPNYAKATIQKYCISLKNLPNRLYSLEENLLFEHIKKSKIKFSKNNSISLIGNYNASVNLYFLMLSGKTFKDYAKSIKKQKFYDEIIEEFYVYSIEFKKISPLTVKSECTHIGSFLE